jgi:hypothetical protein
VVTTRSSKFIVCKEASPIKFLFELCNYLSFALNLRVRVLQQRSGQVAADAPSWQARRKERFDGRQTGGSQGRQRHSLVFHDAPSASSLVASGII